jgi:RHS repeat-associated protein
MEHQYWYHSDHLGSAQLTTSRSGELHERIEYTPYGEIWVEHRYDLAEGSLPYRFTGKELDEETGYYYYGARYLDPRTSRWISTDPAVGDYVPSAPVDDEAKKRNGKLPGMGGVFNLVNLHVYHYAGNNPVKYTDPDGNENKPALKWMKDNITGKNSGYGYAPDPSIPNSRWTPFKLGAENLPSQLLCYESVWASYRNTGTTRDMPASRAEAYDWFKAGGTTVVNGKEINKALELDITKGQQGDVVFMGGFKEMEGHSVLLESLNVTDSTIEMETVGAYSPNGKVGPEKMIFKKNEQGKWENTTHGGNYEFRGYGQYSE